MGSSTNPFMGFVASLDAVGFEALQSAVKERHCRERIGIGTFEEAIDRYRPDPVCPSCGAKANGDGHTPAGRRRYRCSICRTRFSSLTGTVFEYGKKRLPDWATFITLMCYNAPLRLAVEICEVAQTTAFEWRHRVFATVDGYQDRVRLRDRIWIDETYISDNSLLRGPDWTPKRGLSKDKICIVVAIDVHKNMVAIVSGNGKPSSKRMKDALLKSIEGGSVIVHDMEKAHRSLVKAAKCTDEPYRADTKDPVYLERMELVNSLCSWIKRFLWHHTGMKSDNLQSYLNWFVYLFRVKRDDEKWPKTERVIRHLFMSESHYRS